MSTSGKKYLLTGASGYLGYHLVRQLVADGATVLIFDLVTLEPKSHFHLDDDAAARVSCVEGNVLKQKSIEDALEGIDGIFHLAGIVVHSRSGVDLMMKVNIDGTINVIKAAAAVKPTNPPRIVYASSSGVVACQKSRATPPGKDGDKYCHDAVSGFPYYVSKIKTEELVMPLALELGVDVVYIRPTMMLGPGDHLFRSTGLVTAFIEGKIPFVPDGGASFLDVRDSAAMFKRAMEYTLPRPNPTYVLGSLNCTVKEFFHMLEEMTGIPAPTLWLPYPVLWAAAAALTQVGYVTGNPNPSVDPVRAEMGSSFWDVDWSVAANELGFSPRPPEETIRDTIAYVCEHHPEISKHPPPLFKQTNSRL
eukprot:m.31072 g.31072  ORF g.31072 m.31072 type:complete len:364 (+) comp13944_c0_seq2:271-1362(+)